MDRPLSERQLFPCLLLGMLVQLLAGCATILLVNGLARPPTNNTANSSTRTRLGNDGGKARFAKLVAVITPQSITTIKGNTVASMYLSRSPFSAFRKRRVRQTARSPDLPASSQVEEESL